MGGKGEEAGQCVGLGRPTPAGCLTGWRVGWLTGWLLPPSVHPFPRRRRRPSCNLAPVVGRTQPLPLPRRSRRDNRSECCWRVPRLCSLTSGRSARAFLKPLFVSEAPCEDLHPPTAITNMTADVQVQEEVVRRVSTGPVRSGTGPCVVLSGWEGWTDRSSRFLLTPTQQLYRCCCLLVLLLLLFCW